MKRNLYLIIVVIFLFSCCSGVKTSSSGLFKSGSSSFETTRPDLRYPGPIPHEESIINIPIKIPISELTGTIDKAIGVANGPISFRFHIERRGRVTIEKNKWITVPLKLKNLKDFPCELKIKDIKIIKKNNDVDVTSKIEFQLIDLWQKKEKKNFLGKLVENTKETFEDFVNTVNVAPKVVNPIVKKLAEPKINEALTDNINKYADKYWKDIYQEINLNPYLTSIDNTALANVTEDLNVWFTAKPTKIMISDIKLEHSSIRLDLGVGAEMKIDSGNITQYDKENKANIAKISSSNLGKAKINLPVFLSYKDFDAQANKLIKGKKFTYKGNKVFVKKVEFMGGVKDKDTVIVAGVEIDATVNKEDALGQMVNDGKINEGIISALLTKSVRGVVYFYVVPEYNKTTQEVYIKKMFVEPHTKNILINAALPYLIENFYVQDLISNMKFDLSKTINDRKIQVNKFLNDNSNFLKEKSFNFFSSVVVKDLNFENLYITRKGLAVQIMAEAEIKTDPLIF